MKQMTPEGAVSAREWAMQRGTVENYPATARAYIRELADALLSNSPASGANERAAQQLATTGEAKPSIMRFNPIAGLGMNPAANGMYVRYEDHAAMLSRHPASQACEAADMARLVHAAAELHGLITEYQGMPCDSLRQRMFDGARRYGPRIHEARATLSAQPISQKDS